MESLIFSIIFSMATCWQAYVVMAATLMALADLACAAFTVVWAGVRMLEVIRPRVVPSRLPR